MKIQEIIENNKSEAIWVVILMLSIGIMILMNITGSTFKIGPWFIEIMGVVVIGLLSVMFFNKKSSKGANVNRKGQEEITGFVLIVVLVSIVLVVFLGMTLRGDKGTEKESKDIGQFLDAMMEYTSDCALNYEPAYSTINELIRVCHENSGRKCISGKEVCESAKTGIGGMLDASWPVGQDRPIKGLEFQSVYEQNSSNGMIKDELVVIKAGNCSFEAKGAEYISASLPGNIVSSFKLCG